VKPGLSLGQRGKIGGAGKELVAMGAGDALDTLFFEHGIEQAAGAAVAIQAQDRVVTPSPSADLGADSGRDLVVALGTTDRIVLDDRLVNVNGGADRLRFADGKSLSVEALVQAMASFGTPSAGELSLARADVQQYLTPLLASGA
jgi:hypothetical protein